MRKYYPMILAGVVSILIIPSIALAVWWNPFTWFKKKPVEQPIVQITNYSQVGNKELEQVLNKNKSEIVPVLKQVNEKPNTSAVKLCRPEIAVSGHPPRKIDGTMSLYFENIITSNAKLVDIETAYADLLKYRDDFLLTSDPFDAYKDSEGNQIPYTFDELNAIDSLYRPLKDQYIGYLNSWMNIVEKIIQDKKDNGCLDGLNLSYYGASGPFLTKPLPFPKRPSPRSTQQVNYNGSPQNSVQAPSINCANYPAEKTAQDNYFAQNGTLFSSARANADAALQTKYAGCF